MIDEKESAGREVRARPLVRWSFGIVVVTALLSIGAPLIGLRTFFPADLLHEVDPWAQTAPSGLQRTNPILEDVVNAAMPKLGEYRRRIVNGDYPLWTPYPSGGLPLGTQPTTGSLSPLNLPYALLPLWYSPAAAKLLEMAVAILFTFAFLKRVGLGTPASLVGGLVYVNSGFQVVWTNWPHSHIGALVPALFWACELLVQRRSVATVLPVAIIGATMLFEGYPPLAGYAVVAAGAYTLVRVAWSHPSTARERFSMAGLFGAGVLLAAGVAALQILPFLDRIGELDVGYRRQAPGSHLPLRALVTLVFPNAFGSPVDGNYFGGLHYQRTNYVVLNYQELQGFIGAAALVLVLVAATRARRGYPTSDRLPAALRPYLWIGTGILAALIYVGGPPLRALQAVPLFDLAFIGRLRCILGFFLAVLAAIGLQALADEREGEARRGWLLTGAVVAAVAALAAYGLVQVWDLAVEANQRRYVARQALLPLLAGAVALVAAGVGPWLGLGRRVRIAGHSAALWILPVVISVESLAFALPFWPRVPRALFYPSTPAHQFLGEHLGTDRMASGGKAMYPGTATFYGLRSLNAHAFEAPSWRRLMTVADPDVFTPVRPTWALLHTGEDVVTAPVLDRLSVRYFVNPLSAPVLGRHVDVSAPVDDLVLGSGSSVTTTIPAGRIRAVALPKLPGLLGSGEVALHAEILDASGRVISEGDRRVRPVDSGATFVIPVVELGGEAALSDEPLTVRLSLRGEGPVGLYADRTGAPALSVVLGEQDGLRLVFARGVAIYERIGALPRMRWANRARVIPEPSERVEALAEGVASDTVVLSGPGPPGSGGSAQLRVLEDSGDQVRVQVEASGDGYLVVADAMQDGWIASVDGRPAVLRPADHAVVAVSVPAGRHEVRLRYDPDGWRIGQLISVVSAVALISVALWGWIAWRRFRRTERETFSAR
ncbi:MAG: YfhO family protein [Actinomycetota bacterium]